MLDDLSSFAFLGAELGCQNGSQVSFDAGYSEGLAQDVGFYFRSMLLFFEKYKKIKVLNFCQPVYRPLGFVGFWEVKFIRIEDMFAKKALPSCFRVDRKSRF